MSRSNWREFERGEEIVERRPKAKILVVDDEPEIVKAIRTNLELGG